MNPALLDGAVITVGDLEFELRADVNEDGGSTSAVCQRCGVSCPPSKISDHECVKCQRCGDVCVDVVYDDGDQAHLPSKQWRTWCSDDCHDADGEAAEQAVSR